MTKENEEKKLTPIQMARKRYEERIKQDPELKAKRERTRRKGTALSIIKSDFDKADLFEVIDLAMTLFLLQDTLDLPKLSKEERKKLIVKGNPSFFLTEKQYEVKYKILKQLEKIAHQTQDKISR